MLTLFASLLLTAPWLQDGEDDPQDSVDASIEQALQAEQGGRLDEAQSILREARDLAFEHELATAAVDHHLGRILYASGYTAEGLAMLYQANQDRPGLLPIALDLVDALLAERDFAFDNGEPYSADSSLQQASETIAPFLESQGEERELRLRQARILQRTRDREGESIPLYMALLRETPNELPLHGEFVKAVGASGLFERALGFYEGLDMERSLRLWYLGEVHVARAHYHFNRYLDDDQAVKDYRAAERYILEAGRVNEDWFQSASDNAAFHRAWAGWVLARGGHYQEAWKEFRSALGRMAGCASAIDGMNFLGSKFNEEGELENACELYRQLCAYAPDRSDFWNNYGLMCRDTQRYEESYAAYRKAMNLTPNDPRVINDAALILQYHLDRDLDQAERWLLEARDIARSNWQNATDPVVAEDQLLVYGDSLVNLWRLYDDQGRMEEASAMRAEMRAADPNRPELPPAPPEDDEADDDEQGDDEQGGDEQGGDEGEGGDGA